MQKKTAKVGGFFFLRIVKAYFTWLESSLPALNFTTFFAAILISFPVWGFLPFLPALLDTEKVPKF